MFDSFITSCRGIPKDSWSEHLFQVIDRPNCMNFSNTLGLLSEKYEKSLIHNIWSQKYLFKDKGKLMNRKIDDRFMNLTLLREPLKPILIYNYTRLDYYGRASSFYQQNYACHYVTPASVIHDLIAEILYPLNSEFVLDSTIVNDDSQNISLVLKEVPIPVGLDISYQNWNWKMF